MLSTITIKSLYGLYSYSIDFLPNKHSYKFVTGPNAYGKTSLLKMLESLYNQDFQSLANVAFDEFVLMFDDGFRIDIKQNRVYDEDPKSDETEPKKVILEFIACKETGVCESMTWESNVVADDKLNNLTAYLTSHPIYFITDNRLYKGGTEESVGTTLEAAMRDYLRELERDLNTALQQGMLDECEPITEDIYNKEVSRLQPLIDSIVKYELVRRNPIPTFSEEKSSFCHTCIAALNRAFSDDVLGRIAALDALCLIIKKYDFAKKHLELSPFFGFRFKAEDDKQSILSFDQLSSGERHIMLMNCDILFDVEDEALVLIDEPELSFHLEWQGMFMFNLEELIGVRKDLQFIICTHAPEIFGYDWSLSVDLLEQYKATCGNGSVNKN